MLDISVLRTMAKYGATLEMVLAVIEADQIQRERKAKERAERRVAKRANGNGHRTLQQAADDIMRAAEQAPSTTRN